jgi:hypothetical protein
VPPLMTSMSSLMVDPELLHHPGLLNRHAGLSRTSRFSIAQHRSCSAAARFAHCEIIELVGHARFSAELCGHSHATTASTPCWRRWQLQHKAGADLPAQPSMWLGRCFLGRAPINLSKFLVQGLGEEVVAEAEHFLSLTGRSSPVQVATGGHINDIPSTVHSS